MSFALREDLNFFRINWNLWDHKHYSAVSRNIRRDPTLCLCGDAASVISRSSNVENVTAQANKPKKKKKNEG